MSDHPTDRTPGRPGARPTLRPPIGLPLRRERGGWSAVLALLVHVAIVALLITPLVAPDVVREAIQGAGGPGPAGGGGGGTSGTGYSRRDLIRETLHYVPMQPTPAPVPPPPAVTPPVPEVEPLPPPVEPRIEPPAVADPAVSAPAAAADTGAGGGTGTDGSNGSGPGTGGGVGSGIGSGRGSGDGPGTGGGDGTLYTPTPVQLFLPPLPAPTKIRPFRLVAVFDIDETGRILSVDFTQSKDGGYNRKLRETLWQMRFRPAVTGDGTPVRAKYQMTIDI
ncbi:MAG TPA: hypothetical protein VNA89_08495 [Gemmatimonadaceae bacterium]|nr:hypothetical protein [Gemmatimonadaceae bacterium]